MELSNAIHGSTYPHRHPATRNRSRSAITVPLPEATVSVNPGESSAALVLAQEKARAALAELQAYTMFGPGWDGYDGSVFSNEVIRRAQSAVAGIAELLLLHGIAVDEIIPGPASDGSIDVEFLLGHKTLTATFYLGEPVQLLPEQSGVRGALAYARELDGPSLVRWASWLAGARSLFSTGDQS